MSHRRVRPGRPGGAARAPVVADGSGEFLFEPLAGPERKPVGLKAWARVEVAPRPRGAGVEVTVEPLVRPTGVHLSQTLLKAIEAGEGVALASGPRTGAPVQDLRVRVVAVEVFGQATTPEALRAATFRALREAIEQAGGRVLRPIMRTEVNTPQTCLGAVLGDLQARQASIRGTRAVAETVTIDCEVPLHELLGYATRLRSLTQGRGQFSMLFERFDVA